MAAWELGAVFGVIDRVYFPPPSEIVSRSIELLVDGSLAFHLSQTLIRLGVGFGLGAGAGYLTGLVLGLFRRPRQVFEPFLSAIYTVPKIALLPVFFALFGLGSPPLIALVAVSVFFYVWIYTMDALLNLPKTYFDVSTAIGVSVKTLLTRVVIPGTAVNVISGLRVGIAVATLITIAAEFIVAQDGIGYLILNSRALFRLSDSYVGILVAGMLGFTLQSGLKAMGRRLTPWSDTRQSSTMLDFKG
jgi:sulfonate transport system permease protein